MEKKTKPAYFCHICKESYYNNYCKHIKSGVSDFRKRFWGDIMRRSSLNENVT